jgi:hypothetical protein
MRTEQHCQDGGLHDTREGLVIAYLMNTKVVLDGRSVWFVAFWRLTVNGVTVES